MLMYKTKLAFRRPHSLTARIARRAGRLLGMKSMPTPQELIATHAPGKSFADIGCMWGINGALSFFAEQCEAKHVVAVDVYPATEEFTAEHTRLHSKVQFINGDIFETTTLQKIGKVDVVFCSGVLYHMPDPFSLLVRLRAICGEVLILRTMIIPEVSGMRNMAVFYPMLEESQRNHFKLGTGMQKAITGPYEPESGYGNWFWGLTPSCVESLLACAGFEVIEEHVEPFIGWFICRAVEPKFTPSSGEYLSPTDARFVAHLATSM
ncbi:hypothetical protein V1291_004511 [Nitrobacteraceae bacterium AZCC 1564]